MHEAPLLMTATFYKCLLCARGSGQSAEVFALHRLICYSQQPQGGCSRSHFILKETEAKLAKVLSQYIH